MKFQKNGKPVQMDIEARLCTRCYRHYKRDSINCISRDSNAKAGRIAEEG